MHSGTAAVFPFDATSRAVLLGLLWVGAACGDAQTGARLPPGAADGTGASPGVSGPGASAGAAPVSAGAAGASTAGTAAGGVTNPATMGGTTSAGGGDATPAMAGTVAGAGAPAGGGAAGGTPAAAGTASAGSPQAGAMATAGTMPTAGGGTEAGGSPQMGGAAGTATSGAAGAQTAGTGSGGTPSGSCAAEPESACSSPQVRITEVNVGASVISGNDQGDTAPIPLSIAAIPSGGSRLAFLGTDSRVYVAELDCNDQLVGTPFSFPANDFQDIAADDEGGVIALTRDAQGGGTLNCGNEGNLCIAPDSPIPCYDMHLVRFDNAGNEVWATKLTTASSSNPPYTSGGGANHFIWWYQHHTRLAYDGTNYAAYFCDAITIANGSCVDIHEGDRMQVVGPDGSVVNHTDAFEGGCSHSWNTRIVWDDRSSHFVMVCGTDNSNRVARPNPYRTIYSAPDIGTLSVGNLVLASGSGYWVSVSHQGTLRLLHFTEASPDQDVTVANADFSHLASYSGQNMVIAWASGSSLTAQVRSAADGSEVSAQFSIDVPDHRYQAFKSFPDGSVAYPAQGASNQSVRIARVLPCSQ